MLVIISGASGSGKDTIKRKLMESDSKYAHIPSYTTRKKRAGEIDGIDYNFVTKEEFRRLISEDALYEHNIYNENFYGTPKKLFKEAIEKGKIILSDVDVNGKENLIRLLGNDMKIVTIFLKVPKEVLSKRLLERGERPSIEDINKRLSRLDYEEGRSSTYDYVIKNNDIDKSVNLISAIIEEEEKLSDTEF